MKTFLAFILEMIIITNSWCHHNLRTKSLQFFFQKKLQINYALAFTSSASTFFSSKAMLLVLPCFAAFFCLQL